MQTTGIIRKIDELGRIVLPKELRRYLNINPGDDFQITIENEKIIDFQNFSYNIEEFRLVMVDEEFFNLDLYLKKI